MNKELQSHLLSRREQVALAIMQAAISNPGTTNPWGDGEFLPEQSFMLADWFLKTAELSPKDLWKKNNYNYEETIEKVNNN